MTTTTTEPKEFYVQHMETLAGDEAEDCDCDVCWAYLDAGETPPPHEEASDKASD